ncbi:MAG: hypothetical protein Q4A51_06755, partial [Lachnospiraceae bacterium]|nr:hypothetical protein [Lachnospiraceae bacterium]
VKNLGMDPSAIILMGDHRKMEKLVEEGRGVMFCLEVNPLFKEEGIELLEILDPPVNYILAWKKETEVETLSKIKKLFGYLSQWRPADLEQ